MSKQRGDAAAMEETQQLLDRAKASGLLVKDVARILGVTSQQVSTYRHSPMPLNNRRVLLSYLEEFERKGAGGVLYPSQQTAVEHDNLERLSRLTGATGPLWQMYQELATSIIKLAEVERLADPGPRLNGPREDPGTHAPGD